ncbi:MAG TPA: hypothetical protein VJN89_19150 [Candidatus Acidoferrum sp.]|nr:hypothetical protein [Candidatus Acidoferrum sp.]
METAKVPLEKLFFFVAGVIPGLAALLIFNLAVPGSFTWFFAINFLGYRAKLAVMLLSAFIIGNSMTTFLDVTLGMMGGAIGGIMAQKPYQAPEDYKIAPWRDMKWRVALSRCLGKRTPNNTSLISEMIFNIRKQAIDFLPEGERLKALSELTLEKIQAQIDDGKWAAWYDHYHQKVLLGREKWDVQRHVMHGLNFNLETTAIYVLASAFRVPSLRHWWCITPAILWTLIFGLQQLGDLRRFNDPWSTLSQQIEYLSEESRNSSSEAENKPD